MKKINFNIPEQYTMFRRRNKVKLKDVANYIGCSISLLSRWEREEFNMSKDKVILYQKFIKEFNKSRKENLI